MRDAYYFLQVLIIFLLTTGATSAQVNLHPPIGANDLPQDMEDICAMHRAIEENTHDESVRFSDGEWVNDFAFFELNHEPLELEAFPNPSNGIFKAVIKGEGTADGVLEVFDLVGRKVWSSIMNSNDFGKEIGVELTESSAGTFFVHFQSSETSLTKTIKVY